MDENQSAGREVPATDDSALLAELAQYGEQAIPEFVFLQELLKRAMIGLRGEAGAVWLIDSERRLVLQQEVCLEQTGFLKDPAFQAACEKPFGEVFRTGGVVWQQLEQQVPTGEKIRRNLLLGALPRDGQVAGLVQIFESPWSNDEDRPRRMQFLAQLCSLAARFWQMHPQLPPLEAPPVNAALVASAAGPSVEQQAGVAPRVQQTRPAQPPPGAGQNLSLTGQPAGAGGPATPAAANGAAAGKPAEEDPWILSLYERRKSTEVALIAANETRRLLSADRVTVGEQFGPRVRIQAVSGQQSVSLRSNAVRLLSTLAEQVCATGEKLSFTGDTRKFPPQFESLLADYLLESRSRVIIMQPVFGPKERQPETTDSPEQEANAEKPKPVGVLIVEQISETPLPADIDTRLERVAPHVGLALGNAQACERIFLLPLWLLIGNWKSRLRGRNTWKALAVLGAVLLVSLILAIVPWDYRVTGKGRMMPVERRGVFAPWDGEVVELFVQSGQTVRQGDLLLRMKNEDLATNLHKHQTQYDSKYQEFLTYSAQLSDPGTPLNKNTEIELYGKQAQAKAEMDGLEKQIETIRRQYEALAVRAPIDGKVSTFRIDELLRNRPVKFGELLLEVMDDTKSWRLEVDVPENRTGHILEAQRLAGDGKLRVKYMLATDTEKDFYGRLETLSNRSISSENEGLVVPVFVALDEVLPAAPTIGAEVTAKIYCGKRSLGYVWFGDVIEAARKYLWL
ncbi:MAG: HlyD family efflux transporter periplasmic adaptor subunit [Planctomycetes bacterium]|nr:HlyD family efflux transporter periplasmic adaptor subunit [Planctomycetota bacterium]